MSVSIELKQNHLISIQMNGSMDKADLEQIFAEFKPQITDDQKLRVCIEIVNFDFKQIPLEIYLTKLKLWLKDPGMINRLDKVALISDEAWIKALFELECALIPGLQGKNFERDQKVAARSWLSKSSVSNTGSSAKLPVQLPQNLELSWTQSILYASAKSLGGLAFGLWLANYLEPKQRKQVGAIAMLLGLFASIPLALQVFKRCSK